MKPFVLYSSYVDLFVDVILYSSLHWILTTLSIFLELLLFINYAFKYMFIWKALFPSLFSSSLQPQHLAQCPAHGGQAVNALLGDFSGGPVAKNLPSNAEPWVPFLVGN